MDKENILIVDDEKEIRDLVEIYLKGESNRLNNSRCYDA